MEREIHHYVSSLLLVVLLLCVCSSHQQQTRPFSISVRYSQDGGITFTKNIAFTNYKYISQTKPLEYTMDGICDQVVVNNSTGEGNTTNGGLYKLLLESTSPQSPLWPFSMNRYKSFYSNVLKLKLSCTISAQYYVTSEVDETKAISSAISHNSEMMSGLKALERSTDEKMFNNFFQIYGPYVVTDIKYGGIKLFANYTSSSCASPQLISNQEEILIGGKGNSTTFEQDIINYPGKVGFSILTLSDYLAKYKLTNEIVITKLSQFNTVLLDTNYIYQSFDNWYSLSDSCTNNLFIFGSINAESTKDQNQYLSYYKWFNKLVPFTESLNYISYMYYRIIEKKRDIGILSHEKSEKYDYPIYLVQNTIQSEKILYESFVTGSKTEAENTGSSVYLVGYCSSKKHPGMIELNRYFNIYHYYGNTAPQQFKKEYLMCYVYPAP